MGCNGLKAIWRVLASLVIGFAASPGVCGDMEVSLLRGNLSALGEKTYSFQVEASHVLSRDKSWRLALEYLNEGHLKDHHRDAYAVQVWKHWKLGSSLSVGLGGGAGVFYDTIRVGTGVDSENQHNAGLLGSIALRYTLTPNLSLEVRGNRSVLIGKTHGATSIMCGVSYRLHKPEFRPGHLQTLDGNRITVSSGWNIHNHFGSTPASAKSLEWEKALGEGPYSVSVTYLQEQAMSRGKVYVSGGISESFLNDKLRLKASLGASDAHTCLLQVGMDVSLTQKLYLSLTQGRVSARHSKDSDIFMVGLGCRF